MKNNHNKKVVIVAACIVTAVIFFIASVRYWLHPYPESKVKKEVKEAIEVMAVTDDKGKKMLIQLDIVTYVKETTRRGIYPMLKTDAIVMYSDSSWTQVKFD